MLFIRDLCRCLWFELVSLHFSNISCVKKLRGRQITDIFGSLNNFARNSTSLSHCEPVAMDIDCESERHMVGQSIALAISLLAILCYKLLGNWAQSINVTPTL